jgi:hypothetical protein
MCLLAGHQRILCPSFVSPSLGPRAVEHSQKKYHRDILTVADDASLITTERDKAMRCDGADRRILCVWSLLAGGHQRRLALGCEGPVGPEPSELEALALVCEGCWVSPCGVSGERAKVHVKRNTLKRLQANTI